MTSATSPARYPVDRTPTGPPGQQRVEAAAGVGAEFDHRRHRRGQNPAGCLFDGLGAARHRGVDRGSGAHERANHLRVDVVAVAVDDMQRRRAVGVPEVRVDALGEGVGERHGAAAAGRSRAGSS